MDMIKGTIWGITFSLILWAILIATFIKIPLLTFHGALLVGRDFLNNFKYFNNSSGQVTLSPKQRRRSPAPTRTRRTPS
jgi:hypothetical protein